MRSFVSLLIAALLATSAEAFFSKKPKAVKPAAKAAPAAPTKRSDRVKPSTFKPAPAAGSKQRSYKLGGKTPGPELYDDGLTTLERKYIVEGKSNALAGAAKLRAMFAGGKGF